MIKKIKRLPFYIPMIPVLVVGYIFLPIRWASSTIVEFCDNLIYEYGLILRQKFPGLVIEVRGSEHKGAEGLNQSANQKVKK